MTLHTTPADHRLWPNRQQRDLLRQLVRRDLASRYRGSTLGILWSVLNPLLMLGVYTFVFGVVFQARWGENASHSTASFAMVLYCGLMVHAALAEILTRSTTIILQHRNYVKKVVFPLQLLPVMIVMSATVLLLIQWAILLAGMALAGMALTSSILLWPVIMIPFLLLSLGLAWFVASMGVYIRDLAQIMGLLVTLLLFLSPVFYPASALPEAYRTFLYLNPLTPIIENSRLVVIEGVQPHWQSVGIYAAFSLLSCVFGHWWFIRTRKGFNDVV